MKKENLIKILISMGMAFSTFVASQTFKNTAINSGNSKSISALETADRYQIRILEEINKNVRDIRKEILRK